MAFVKGQSGNPGGRPSPQRQQLDTLLGQVFTVTKRKQVLEKLIEDAIAGQHDARTLLLAYTFGKPIERQEISGPDGEPLKAYVSVSPDNWDAADSPDSAV